MKRRRKVDPRLPHFIAMMVFGVVFWVVVFIIARRVLS